MPEYKNPTIKRLYELYQENKDKELTGIFSQLWKVVGPSIPDILASLDMDAELFKAVKDLVIKLAGVLEEQGDD